MTKRLGGRARSNQWTFSGVYIALLVMLMVSTAALLLRGPTHEFGGRWWADGIEALAEAVFVAGILGFTVDRLLKSVLVREVARLALSVIFGANAPQEYVNSLQADLQSIQSITTNGEWVIYLDWHSGRTSLKVTCEITSNSQNISSTPAAFRSPWLVRSAEGAPDGYFGEYRCQVWDPSVGARVDP